jgi:hypothetical protein
MLEKPEKIAFPDQFLMIDDLEKNFQAHSIQVIFQSIKD